MQKIIEFINITKKFENLIANDNITFDIKKSEIHAIIGENGAGKSTLMKQLFGLLTPTFGTIKIKGKIANIANPNDASKLGIGMVHQHFQLVENHTVLENIILGSENSKPLEKINYKEARHKLISISNQYNLKIDPNMLVKKASVGQQQRIEILKMLYSGVDILIFDEPTAMLIPSEIKGLLHLFKDLKKMGKTIIFISHKLDEVKEVANWCTAIRSGKKIKTFNVLSTSTTQMAEMMVGRKLVNIKNNLKIKLGQNVLSIENISVKHRSNSKALGLKNFSLNIKEGEIVAIAGVEGNGQIELAYAIAGLMNLKKGKIKIINNFKKIKNNDQQYIDISNKSTRKRYELGLSYVPEDRYKHAMRSKSNLFQNIIFQTFYKRPFSFFGILTQKHSKKWTYQVINEFDVRGANNGNSLLGSLSGGNQQKFIIGREMTRQHKLLLLFQPTHGLDIGAIEFIHQKILEEKTKNIAVLLISYDLSEVMSLADRIAVINQGNLIKITNARGLTRNQVGKWMAGVK